MHHAVVAPAHPCRWWRSGLILALGVQTFGIIFCKTVVEYQYNVLVSGQLSAAAMVALTGQLYATAGTPPSHLEHTLDRT